MPIASLSSVRKLSKTLIRTLTLAALPLSLSSFTQAQTESVLYSFTGNPWSVPYAGVVRDSSGNLYGTTLYDGAVNLGTVFKLSPTSGGGWRESYLHSFTGGDDGAHPYGGLVIGSDGNLYGTAADGGASGFGTVFMLSPITGEAWHETVLHAFTGGIDGKDPVAALIFDSAGNLYGTTAEGGVHGYGTAFELAPIPGGGWHYILLHAFTGGADGRTPGSNLTFDSAGNLYGTTQGGGIATGCIAGGLNGCGVVFELSPRSGGLWHETILHAFGSTDGASPYAGVTFDPSGNLYGTTIQGGNLSDCASEDGCGVVFELSPTTGSGWHETVIHAFTGGADGYIPGAGVILDSMGNVYGTADLGGDCCGVVFEFSLASDGTWNQTILHNFDISDGYVPAGTLIFDPFGNLFGTAQSGGAFSQGVVYEVTP